jgi:hypothetical protein
MTVELLAVIVIVALSASAGVLSILEWGRPRGRR